MKLLIDNNLSPRLSLLLKEHGHDVIHIGATNMYNFTDIEIFKFAFEEKRIIITADTDCSCLLSQWNYNQPSLILFRYFPYDPEFQSHTIIKILTSYETELTAGSIVVVEPDRIRIRNLPIHK